MFLSRFLDKLRKDPPEREAYRQIVVAARRPEFYASLGVPDTVTGRFDLLTLHAFLVLDRLRIEKDEETARFAQGIFDEMFLDMDHNLREMGVGDVAVGKKVRRMAEVFYGHVGAYRRALEEGDDEALEDALNRNIYGGEAPPEILAAMRAHVHRAGALLAARDAASLRAGDIPFPPPPAPDGAGETEEGGAS